MSSADPTAPLPPKLSVALCVHNEAGQLADCLETLAFADEIVVVLDRCSDGSSLRVA